MYLYSHLFVFLYFSLFDSVLAKLGQQLLQTISPFCWTLAEQADWLAQLSQVLFDLRVVGGHVHHPYPFPSLELGQHLVVALVEDGRPHLQGHVLVGRLHIVGVGR